VIRVVIADDQALVRGGLAVMLEAEPDLEVVGEAADGRQAIDQVRAHRPDVVLMDVRMPGMGGIDATRTICAASAARVLMLTTFDLDEYVYDSLRAGASGFLLKDAPPEEFVRAVRSVAAGDSLLAPSVTRRLIEEYTTRPARAARDERLARLSEREAEVLRLVARGLPNAEIAAALVIAETTVKTHIARMEAKLEVRDRVQLVVAAYELGFVRPGERARAESAPGGRR
jgi:DNA-binding NarL/FixJ family response regulator